MKKRCDEQQSGGRATAMQPRQPQLQPSPAQRCHPDPLSIAFSFLSLLDFTRSSRVCRTWFAASQRKTAWPQPSLMQLADFSQEHGRVLSLDLTGRGVSIVSRVSLIRQRLQRLLDSDVRLRISALRLSWNLAPRSFAGAGGGAAGADELTPFQPRLPHTIRTVAASSQSTEHRLRLFGCNSVDQLALQPASPLHHSADAR